MKFTNNSTSIMEWDSFGNGSREFRHHAITIDSKDNVYVDYEDNENIQKFTNNGAFIDHWGYQGKQNPPYGFNEHHGLAVDSKDNVYLIDTQNYLVQKSDSDGNYISSWGKLGVKEGEFLLVSDIYRF
ncbi:MAG: hypothetical protein ACPKPY_03375 [Nitrososphaeraceae archaeon]